MTPKSWLFIRITIAGLALILIVAVTAMIIKQAEQSRGDIPVLGQTPNFEFAAADGSTFGLKQMQGKISVLDFMFTRCKGPCPIMSGNMKDLYELYRGHEEIQFVSVTVDPEYDSVAILAQYALDKGVNDNRWKFLWAPKDSVAWLSELGFMLAADDLPGGHSTKFVLVDANGAIRGYYDGTDKVSIGALKTDIRLLARNQI